MSASDRRLNGELSTQGLVGEQENPNILAVDGDLPLHSKHVLRGAPILPALEEHEPVLALLCDPFSVRLSHPFTPRVQESSKSLPNCRPILWTFVCRCVVVVSYTLLG